ncbi:uncharacterized protein LOC114362587 [Ostrinia furnacalis]|uniref:uncharacterized protein LOC114362587 n=1 Tax=Ostrinia furnacalis TaxID=93504 RepID=UPI00103AE1DF|nr:uncharacterized protein LOC114362587 [Ostrinia furnacalis]
MGMTLAGFLLPLLLVLPVKGVDLRNGTLPEDAREARASKRVVRLYSGTRPKPIVCEHEGFQADPADCTIFHRCMKNGNGRYVSFKFQCGPGTIYDPDTEICNHPQSTKRTECGGSLHIPSVEFAFDNEINREVPSPISTRHPESTEKVVAIHHFSTQKTTRPETSSFASKYPWALTTHLYSNAAVSTLAPFVNKQQQTESSKAPSTKREVPSSYFTTPFSQKLYSTTAKIDFQYPASNLQSGDLCTANGFMGDSENCRKFYRCISNQRGGFIRYEFLCNDPTIWDEDKKACNHAWAVTRRRCGRESFIDDKSESKKTVMKVTRSELTTTSKTTSLPSQSQLQINYGSKVTQTQTQISNGSVVQNQTQINYGNDTNIKNDKPSIVQNQTQISHGNAVSQSQTQINYGDEAVQTQLQIDHSKEASQAQMQISQTSSTTKTTQYSDHQMVSTTSSNNGCTESGFMGDSKDCKKFYRCVDNGKGGFTRYEFSCGEGTVWDPNLEACNHAWAVKECGGKAPSGSTTKSTTKVPQSTTKVSEIPSTSSTTTSSTTSTSTQNYYSTTESEDDDNNDIGYGNQPVSPATAKPAEQVTTEYKEPQSPSDNKCKSSGFMGDNKDCKKFYRCVDNGNGGYTRYEFSCGEGTVWDQTIEACNHAWAVKNCGGNAEFEHPTDKSTTTTIVSTTSTQTSPQNDDYDTGYGLQPSHDQPSSTIKPTTIKSTTTTLQSLSSESSIGNICTSSGFMGDNKDCKKFYRCVENGNGGYTRYEFSCGEGTVWDPKIQSCNHAWAVEKCGGNSVEDVNKVESTTQKETRPTSSTSTQSNEPDDNNDVGYGQQSQEPQPSTSTTYHPENQSPGTNKCSTSGFMGDPNDCKKFYRCVDNGDSTFTRYEFSCGEGTVWDSKIDACNHAWAVEKCGSTSSSTSSTSSSTTPINNEGNSNNYPVQSDEYPSQTTTSTVTSLSTTSSLNVDNNCQNSGFMGDTQDCKKFYRCVEDGNGKYTRYEFACGEGTVWDQSIEACNHAWAVSRHCADEGNNNQSGNVELTTQHSSSSETEKEDQSYNKPTTQKTSTSTIYSEPSGYECTQEGFYGDNNNCKKFYRCVDNGQGGFIKYEFTCGEGTVWNQDVQTCDHETSDSKCSSPAPGPTTTKPNYEQDTMSPESTTKALESSTTHSENTSQKPQSPSNKCENEGFYGDPNDCKKFYRCVDDGKGDFTKYEFTCGDGTIWDQEILACNHESSNSKCTSSNMNLATTTSATDTGSGSSSSTQENQTTPKPETTSISSGSDKCAMEGFFANTNDCKKFYRCVDNGKGGFTKYDFTCGEGTVWVQEIQACDYDNDISSCTNKDSSSNPQTIEEKPVPTESSPTGQATSDSQPLDKEDDEYPSESSSKPSNTDEKCTSEGFFGNKNDCTRFYRCVDNGQGGYTKYDFTCGEGTAWDSNIQTCNHKSEVDSCQKTNQESSSEASHDEGSSQTTGSTSTGNEPTSSKPPSKDKCEQEGFFGNSQDCTKFYRCVDNGNGGLTKYDFTCGEGTIWDQDLTTCNHPQDVANPSCKSDEDNQSSSEMSSSTEGSSSSSASSSSTASQSSEGTTESSNQGSSNCSQESSSKKPESQSVKCEKAGFFADPNDCKKFYRCVDWDGDGKRFSIYHFDCGEGTIWDPQLETCNHEDSVYPPRDCSGSQSANASQETTSTTTQKSTTTEQSSTTESTTTQSSTEESTTQQISSSEQTTQQTTTEHTTTQEPSTSESVTTEKTTTTTTQEPTTTTTTQQSSTDGTTTTQQSTDGTTTTQQSTDGTTTTQQSTDGTTTTQQSTDVTTTTQQTTDVTTTTQQNTTSETTTQESSSTDETTTESMTTEQQSTTTEKSSEQSTTQQQTTTGQETTTTESTTTESSQGTTSQETSAEKDCPETEDDQYLYVCPTSFRRHPKYCNMFYQCTEDNDSHDVKIASFKCPNNTIYDESKSQCVEEDKADKKCNGQTAQRHRVKRLNLNYKEPIEASRSKHTCSGVGYYPYEENECSGIFLKCESTKAGKIRGYVYRCPEGYTYWSISKRCEKRSHMKGCKQSDKSWRERWEIPVEKKNIAK